MTAAMTKAENKAVHECHICSHGFKDKRTLSSHMKSHTLKPGNCNECGLNFADNASLQKHMKVHRLADVSGDSEKLTKPSDVAKDDELPQKPTEDTQNGDRTHSNINPLTDSSNHDTKLHHDKNINSDAAKTNIVASNVESTAGVVDSKSSKNHEPEEVFKCTVCEKGFQLKGQMVAHRKLHGAIKVRNNTTKVTVKAHVLGQDEKKKSSCSVCKAEFADVSKLRKHLLDKKSVRCYSEAAKNNPKLDKAALFSCDLCDQQFMWKSNIRRHKQQVHPDHNQFNFRCQVCNKGFSKEHHLKIHQRVHLDNKDNKLFECRVCNKAYTRKANLNIHQRVHVDDMNKNTLGKEPSHRKTPANGSGASKVDQANLQVCLFKCQMCSMVFKNRSAYVRHKQWRHSKMFKCKSCRKVFTRQSKFDEHQRTHQHDKKQSRRGHGKSVVSLKSSSTKQKVASHPSSQALDKCKRKPLQTINRDDSEKTSENKAQMSTVVQKTDSSKSDDTVVIRLNMCALCGFTFSSIQSLTEHSTNAHGILVTGIVNKDVQKKMKRRRRTSIPMERPREQLVKEESVFSYNCPACKVEIQGSHKLVLHIKGHMEEF